MKGVEAGGSNVLTEKRAATTLSHASSAPTLLESAWLDRQVEEQGPGHRWTKVPLVLVLPLDPENKILKAGNRGHNAENKMHSHEDHILAASNAYETRNGARA